MYRHSLAALVVLPIVALTAQAQFFVAPRAGLVHHLDGEVLIEDQALNKEGPPFGWVGEGEILRTGEDGLCEVLLAPGSVLRIGPNGSLLLLSEDITNVRLELLSGSAIIDWSGGSQDRPIRLLHGESRIELNRRGIYRLDAYAEGDAQLRVFEGQAELVHDGTRVAARGGQAITLNSGDVEGFDTADTDSLDDWNQERAQFIARVNSLERSGNQRFVDAIRDLFRRSPNSESRSRRRFHNGSRMLAGSGR